MKKILTLLCVSLALTSTPVLAKFGRVSVYSFRPAPVRISPIRATPRPVTPAVAPKPAAPAPAPRPAPAPAPVQQSSSFFSTFLPAFMAGWFVSEVFDSDDEKDK